MDENRKQAYLNLIKELLSCPSGDELALLQANEELIDPDFIQVLEQAAAQMASNGEQEAANFLQDLAEQLTAAFAEAADLINPDRSDRVEAYLKLTEAFMRCRNGEEAMQILTANSDLVDAGLVMTMMEIAEVLAERGEENGADFLKNLASQLAEALELTPSDSVIEY